MQLIWQEILTHVFWFAVLLALLKRYLWGPVLGVLDTRSAKVQSELEQSIRAREQMERAKADYEQHLAEIETEARQKLQVAVADGKRVAEEIQQAARQRADALLEKAREGIELELDKAKVQLRDDMARMVTEATSRLLHERVDAQKDRDLVGRMLDEMEATEG